MDHGLSENFTDRVSPIKAHVEHLRSLGVEPGPLNPYVNSVTSDVVKVRGGPHNTEMQYSKIVFTSSTYKNGT